MTATLRFSVAPTVANSLDGVFTFTVSSDDEFSNEGDLVV